MNDNSPFHPGRVDWTGDNPGIYLRETVNGPYVTLMVYFRIVYSKHGPGTAMLLLEDPYRTAPSSEIFNVMLGNNDQLSHYLLENFCKKFGAFKDLPALRFVRHLPLESCAESGDACSSFAVSLRGGGHSVDLSWGNLGEPFAADVPPQKSATGHHEMYSCFIEAHEAAIRVDGRRLSGNPYPRDFMGRPTSSAFLAFSETWVRQTD